MAHPARYIEATDPVCGMKVDRASARHMAEHGRGADPARYTGGPPAPEPMPAGTRRLALATMRNIRQNLFFALVYNAAGVPVAAGVLYPLLGVLVSPMLAAAMSLSSVSVIGNALRLRGVRLDA